jgi:hypothetical protein
VDLAAGVAEAFDQPRLDGRVAVLESLVQHKGTAGDVLGQHIEFPQQGRTFPGIEDADPRQPLGVRAAGEDVVGQQLAIQQHVLAGEEGLDAGVDSDARLLPQQPGSGCALSHGRCPRSRPSRRPG